MDGAVAPRGYTHGTDREKARQLGSMNSDSANAGGGSMDGTVAPGGYTHGKLVDDRGGGEDAPNGRISKFLALLHEVISDPDTDTWIHWLPCGTRFMISNKMIFAKEILS